VTYKVVFRDEAGQAFRRLDKSVQRRIQLVIGRLAENPRPGQATRLVGDPNTWRVRAGAWRILYEIDEDQVLVLVLDIGHRSTAYGGH
jgi:mRNA interferase RelE/StbE